MLLLALGSLISTKLFAQTTYTWNAIGGGDWGTAANWTPSRTTPATNDILQFTDGNTYVVSGVTSQTIRQLFVNTNTNVSLRSSAAATIISINGLTAIANLAVTAGSNLQISSTGLNALDVRFVTTTGQLGSIAGTLTINPNGAFTNSLTTNTTTTIVTVASGGAIVNNGGVVTSSATTLIFAAGSTYRHAMDGGTIPTVGWNAASSGVGW